MADLKRILGREAFSKGFDLVYSKIKKDKAQGTRDLFNFAEKYLSSDRINAIHQKVDGAIDDPNSALSGYIDRIIEEINKDNLKTAFLNIVYEGLFTGSKVIKEKQDRLGVSLPWLIMMEPFNSDEESFLSLEDMAGIIEEGRELGIFIFIFSGKDPLVKQSDIMALANKYSDCQFILNTDGKALAQGLEVQWPRNIMVSLNFDEVDESIVSAMEELKSKGILFGTSLVYNRDNCEKVTSGPFLKDIISHGAKFVMYKRYMPVGPNADPELMVTPEQGNSIIARIRDIRNVMDGEGIFALDLKSDSTYLGGKMGGLENILCIKSNGQAGRFSYIDSGKENIREKSLVEILKSL